LAAKRNNKVIPEHLQFTHSQSAAHVYAKQLTIQRTSQ
jgi:hypothetical protein